MHSVPGFLFLVVLLNVALDGVQSCNSDSNCYSSFCFNNRKCGCKPGTCGIFCHNKGTYCRRSKGYVSDCLNGVWMDSMKKCLCYGDYGVDSRGRCSARGKGKCDPPCSAGGVCGPKNTCICRRADGSPGTGCTGVGYVRTCNQPPVPEKGQYTPVREEYAVAETIEYTCAYGYRIEGYYSVRKCMASGNWDRPAPKCVEDKVFCDDPPNVPYGSYPPQDVYVENDRVIYECEGGFYMEGEASLECQSDGTWYPDPPTCHALCPPPAKPEAGSYFPEQDSYRPGDMVTISCDYGYETAFTCQDDGTWQYGAEVECPKYIPCYFDGGDATVKYSPVQRSYVAGETITFECASGYCLAGPSVFQCVKSGNWVVLGGVEEMREITDLPQCELGCLPPVVGGGGVLGAKSQYCLEERIEFFCEEGYASVGAEFAVCLEGTWSGVAECIRVCPPPKKPDGGSYDPVKDSYTPGDVVTFSCEYDDVTTDTCQEDGAWLHNIDIECPTVLQCTFFGEVANGKYSPVQDAYNPGDTITFECDTGLCLIGESVAKCMEDGEWDQMVYPTCAPGCQPPVIVDGGIVDAKPLYCQGEYIKYFCQADYTNTGQHVARCTNGNWDGLADCEPAMRTCARPVLENGGVEPDQTWYDARASVDFYCKAGYKLRGNLRTKCSPRGTWGTIPSCAEHYEAGTCEGRCSLWNYRSYSCQCNFNCKWLGTCCSDYDELCGGYERED